MSSTMQFFRANTGVMIITLLLVMGALVFGLIAFVMMRAGASLRPIAFVAGFFFIVAGPQALFHYSQALGWIPKKDLVWVPGGNGQSWRAREELLVVKDGKFAAPADLFGSSFDADLVSDLRTRLENVFGTALAAEMVVLRTGGSVVLAQFANAGDAQRSAKAYAIAMFGGVPAIDPDGTRTVNRAADAVKMVVAGRTLVAYTATNAADATKMLKASPIVARYDATASNEPEFRLYRVSTLIPLTLLLVFCAVVWFFRMSMWASEAAPESNVHPVDAATLRSRLLEVNNLDVPFAIAPSPEDSSLLVVTWRYADAKWIDLARAHGIRRTHRIIMRLDEAHAIVRPTEQISLLDWDAGKSGGSVRWATQRGITFFQYEHERVFGLQLDSNNRLTPNLSYSYTFNLQEMKAPLIAAVTHSGWKWRPTMVQGPAWLHWLTQ